jgi:DNA-binding HxlR family transcriptional regulator
LIQELKTLVDSKLVSRINYGEVPPKVEYRLTTIGKKILPLIANMKIFATAYEAELRKKR